MNAPEVPPLPATRFRDLRWGTKRRDLLAVVPLVVWYGVTAVALVSSLHAELKALDFAHPDYGVALAVLAKCATLLFCFVVVALLFIRLPPRKGASGILPRVTALLGTYLAVGVPLLVHPATLSPSTLACSIVLILFGTGFALHAILYLGRSFSVMPEARRLVTTGPYSRIRHPLYLGEEIATIGVVLQYISPAAVAILLCQMACQWYRMGREEAVLSEAFPDYVVYKEKTARVFPGIY